MDRAKIDALIADVFAPSAPKPKKRRPDLSEPPSTDARAGRMAGEARNYDRTWGDTGQDVEAILRDIATSQPEALVKAFEEPGLDTATNAAVQTALVFGQPLKAAGAAGAGLGAAGLNDMGLFGGAAAADDMDPLGPSRARFDELQAKLKKGKTLSRAEREEQNTYLQTIQAAQTAKIEADKAKQTAEDEAKQGEFNRSVANAEAIRDQELGRVRRFSDTEVGKVFEELGGTAPGVAGVAAGALTRGALGPSASKLVGYGAPIATGAGAGITAINVPLAYNAFMTEPDNPEKAAYGAYARELPPGHPRKQEMATYAAGLPDANPVRKQASEELYDPTKLAERLFFGSLEGALGGVMGKEVIDVLGRGYRAATGQNVAAASPGTVADDLVGGSARQGPGGGQAGMPPVPAQSNMTSGPYKKLPSDVRGRIQDEYVAGRAISGGGEMDTAAAPIIKQALERLGYDVPVTGPRIKATNDAVKAFIQREGREPSSRADWSRIFNDKTLTVPLAVGTGGAAMSDPELEALLAEIMGGGG